MTENPYRTPDEAKHYTIDWRRWCLRGLWAFLLGFVVGVIAPMFRFTLREPPILAWGLLAVAVVANIVSFAGILAALIGGIGWLASTFSRRN